jgi:hypothetical protein
VALEDGEELVELNGDDFVLDVVGELELPRLSQETTTPSWSLMTAVVARSH